MNKKIVIAAGGTGGHLFPAASIKKALEKLNYDVILITDNRGKRFANDFKKMCIIIGGGMSGESFFYRLKSLSKLFIGFLQTFYYLLKIRPLAIIGMGGYISVPVVLVGKILGKKTFIHNADSILGNANILLSKFADFTMISFKNTKKIPSGANTIFTGLPVRDDIYKFTKKSNQNNRIVITIMGGSQGAKLFSTIIPDAISKLESTYKNKIFVYQQVVEEDINEVKKIYKKINVQANIKSFFTNPIELLSQTDIFIGRSGASTVLEIGTLGIPSIFIPIMHKDRQQFINAEQITSVGGGYILEQPNFTVENLFKILNEMITKPNLLEKMTKKARIFENNNVASEKIANLVDTEIKKRI